MRSVIWMGVFLLTGLCIAACDKNANSGEWNNQGWNNPNWNNNNPNWGNPNPPVVVPPGGGHPGPGNWAYLGQTVVNYQGERESIACDSRQNWRRLQLTVSDGAVELSAIRVNFAAAGAQPYDVPVNNYVLTPRNPSMVIELPGEPRRNITRIDFKYRAVDNNPRPTRLTVQGQ